MSEQAMSAEKVRTMLTENLARVRKASDEHATDVVDNSARNIRRLKGDEYSGCGRHLSDGICRR